MAKQRSFQVTISEADAFTLVVALSEYLYLREEGNFDELMEELGLEDEEGLLSALEAADLQARLEGLLQ